MDKRYKNLFKNVGILTISNFSSKILIFLLVPLYTSVLSTEEYGIYDLIYNTIQILVPVLTLNIKSAAMRFLMLKEHEPNEILAVGLRWNLFSILVVAVLLYINHLFSILDIIAGYEIYILLYFVFSELNLFYIEYAKGLEKVTDMGVAGVIGSLVMVLGNIFFLLVLKLRLKGYFIANILAVALQSLYLMIRVGVRNVTIKTDKNLSRNMIRYSWPLIFTTIGWTVNSSLDKFSVTLFCGVSSSGILAVAYKIPAILTVLTSIFILAWQISAINEIGKKDTVSYYTSTFQYLNIIGCIVCSVLIVLTKAIAKFMFTNEFYNAWEYTPILIFSATVNTLAGFCGSILSAKMDSKNMGISSLVSVFTNFILNFVLTYFFGIQGAVIATAVSSFALYIMRRIKVGTLLQSSAEFKVYISWVLLIIQSLFEIYTKLYAVQVLILIIILIVYQMELKVLLRKWRSFLER